MLTYFRAQLSVLVYFLFVSYLMASGCLSASESRGKGYSFCQEAVALEAGRGLGSNFDFEVSISCSIPGHRMIFPNLSRCMLDSLIADGQYEIEDVGDLRSEHGLSGYAFKATEHSDLSHGSVSIRSLGQLIGQDGTLLLHLNSLKIKASRYAKYTLSQTVQRAWTQSLSYQVDFKTTKKVKIRKPKLVLENLFIIAVLRGLKEDITRDSKEMIVRFEALKHC